MCSTPRQELTQGLATGRAGTPPTLPGLPSSEPVTSLGLAMPSSTPPTSPLIQTEVIQAEVEGRNGDISDHRLHTVKGLANNIQNPTTVQSKKATFVNLIQASISGIVSSRKPKPWHLIKKHGIVPDGLVQARLTQFQQLTNQGRGESVGIISGLGLTNGKSGKRKAERLDSPGAKQKRRN